MFIWLKYICIDCHIIVSRDTMKIKLFLTVHSKRDIKGLGHNQD